MNVKLKIINADEKKVYYDVFKDDGVTLILSGESADYSAAIPDPSVASFTDFAAVVVADATAKKDAFVSKVNEKVTAYQSSITALTSDKAGFESQIVDLGTAVVPVA